MNYQRQFDCIDPGNYSVFAQVSTASIFWNLALQKVLILKFNLTWFKTQ